MNANNLIDLTKTYKISNRVISPFIFRQKLINKNSILIDRITKDEARQETSNLIIDITPTIIKFSTRTVD